MAKKNPCLWQSQGTSERTGSRKIHAMWLTLCTNFNFWSFLQVLESIMPNQVNFHHSQGGVILQSFWISVFTKNRVGNWYIGRRRYVLFTIVYLLLVLCLTNLMQNFWIGFFFVCVVHITFPKDFVFNFGKAPKLLLPI